MTGHTLATGRAATLIKLAFAAGAKLNAAFIAFGLTALVTRNMPNDEAGLFLLGFSILAVLCQFSLSTRRARHKDTLVADQRAKSRKPQKVIEPFLGICQCFCLGECTTVGCKI